MRRRAAIRPTTASPDRPSIPGSGTSVPPLELPPEELDENPPVVEPPEVVEVELPPDEDVVVPPEVDPPEEVVVEPPEEVVVDPPEVEPPDDVEPDPPEVEPPDDVEPDPPEVEPPDDVEPDPPEDDPPLDDHPPLEDDDEVFPPPELPGAQAGPRASAGTAIAMQAPSRLRRMMPCFMIVLFLARRCLFAIAVIAPRVSRKFQLRG